MDKFGFIHGELDIKLLILFVLRRLPNPVEIRELSELCSVDSGVGWFDYTDCLTGLVNTGHVEELSDSRYVITEKGKKDVDLTGSAVPYSVRIKAEKLIRPVAERMRREDSIDADPFVEPDGSIKVKLKMSDSNGEVLNLSILSSDMNSANLMCKNFKNYAESIFMSIVNILIEKRETEQ
ncbi:MAG: DUF4364 family protein [Ruminococcaceae bacterium]|nr:DUF4364 family protein [Oscillospiraceae bacterium]